MEFLERSVERELRMNLAIYGAQAIALGTHEAIKTLYLARHASCFLVTSLRGNAPMLGGLPVREIADYAKEMSSDEKDNTEILIAAPENVHAEIEKTLERYGFHYHQRIDSVRWAQLMQLFYVRTGIFQVLSSLPIGLHKAELAVYQTKFYRDKMLHNSYELPDYLIPIQAGAELTDVRVAEILDNTGEHISYKNGNYSELTALYWVWKNILCKNYPKERPEFQCYYGLAHYRRILSFTQDDLLRLVDNNVDVVLPYPMPYEPDINVHHERYLRDVDWQALKAALKELRPEYAKAFENILGQKYLFNYNVIVAKKSVLKDYCEWLFPILERTEELSVPKGKERADRYIGYMGEVLETLYFMYNQKKLNMVFTGCRFFT